MAANAATGSCQTTISYRLSVPKLPSSHKLSSSPRPFRLCSYRCSISSLGVNQTQTSKPSAHSSKLHPPYVSSPETAVVEEEAEKIGTLPGDEISLGSGSLPPLSGCKTCGREEIQRGCNGEGRIQGGIATIPGFGWWPIKAYRPCPAYVASGGRYRRTGQSMDEVVSGGGGRGANGGGESR